MSRKFKFLLAMSKLYNRLVRSAMLCLLISLGAGLAGLNPAQAQFADQENIGASQSLYEVKHIRVELNVTDGLQAKREGLTQAKRRALQRLISRLTFNSVEMALPNLPHNYLESLVKDFTYEEEKFGSGVYVAVLTVRFIPDAVRQFFALNNLQYSETKGPTLLIIPRLQLGTQTLLWGQDNPLGLAFKTTIAEYQDGLVGLLTPDPLVDHNQILPEAELITEINDIISNPQATLTDNFRRLSLLYKSDGAIFVDVKLSKFGLADLADVQIIPLSLSWRQAPITLQFSGNSVETRQDFLERLSLEIMVKINQIWKTKTFVNPDSELSKIRILSDLTSLKDWLAIKELFGNVAGLDRLIVRALKTDRVWFDVFLRGGVEQLNLAIAPRGYQLQATTEAGAEYQMIKIN